MEKELNVIQNIGRINNSSEAHSKEFNIVSGDNGEFLYDLREWDQEHDSQENGISFTTEEAHRLLDLLMKCFDVPEAKDATTNPSQYEKEIATGDPLIRMLNESGFSFIDKRSNGGAVWVLGGEELREKMEEIHKAGYEFIYLESGSRATKRKPGWYYRAGREKRES